MSDHLVEPPPKGWGSWKQCVKESGVKFNGEQFMLGEDLIARSEIPDLKPRVLAVRDFPSQISVGHLLESPISSTANVPIHPLLLLILARGIQGAKDDNIFTHMQYETAMSPFLLSHPTGGNYLFVLRNDRKVFTGHFKPLQHGDGLPRCTHIYGYPPEQEPSPAADMMFRTRKADGKYGPYYSF